MRDMFHVVITWIVSLYQSCNGNLRLVVARAAMKVSLNVWIALLAALTQ
jgi:hypothetical protein